MESKYKLNKKSHDSNRKQRRGRRREWILGIKEGLECPMCGEKDVPSLCFHHRNPSQKINKISRMVANCCSEEKILLEIEKCDVICVGCHNKVRNNPYGIQIYQGWSGPCNI